MYATVLDLRGEGVTEAMASDARLELLLDEATAFIDRVTGWFFEPRLSTFRLNGRGAPSLELPVPPIRLDRLVVNDTEWSHTPDELVVVGAPIQPGFDGPRLTRRHDRVFPRGQGNVVVEGQWGFTEDDGTAEGRTPPAIRRACMLLVLRTLSPLANDEAFDERARWRVIEERTRDQAIKFGSVDSSAGGIVGDPDIELLLAPYMRPPHLGAV